MYENIKSHFILKLWSATLLSLFGLLPTMTLFRLFTYWTYGQNVPFSFQLIEAFWMGIRFDLVVLFYGLAPTSVIFMLLYLTGLKISDQILKLFSTIYLTIFGLFCSIVLAADMKYYSYFQDHINILFFGLFNDDTSALIATFWKNYPVLLYAFLFSATAVLLFLYFKKSISYFIEFATSKPEANPKNESRPVGHSLLQRIPIVIAIFGFIFIGGRGSFGLFPLGPADTVISNNSFINYLTSNGIHALYRAIKLKKKQNASWDSNLKFYSYTSPSEAIKDYLGTRDFLLNSEKISTNPSEDALFKTLSKSLQHKTAKNKWASETRPHVVVIVMESFGTYWLKYQSSTFDLLGSFQEHTQKDLFLTNFLPSSDSTTGSLSSLMISSPHRPIGNFLTESEYLQVPFQTSPAKVYKNHGYKTRFIYGGNPGWRDMNKFAKYQGFDTIEGDVDIESKLGPLSEKHDWGVYDEDLFKYIEVTLKEAQEPQMLLVMTTTNHPPYQSPQNFNPPPQRPPPDLANRLAGDNKALATLRFKVYLYSTDQLGQFLTRVKSSDLASKTLIAVTGDHSFNLIPFSDSETFLKWSVPFYLYSAGQSLKSIPRTRFGSHLDIFPTLYNLSLSDATYESFGKNLADNDIEHFALHSSGVIANDQGLVIQFGGKNFASFNWKKNKPDQIFSQENAGLVEYQEKPSSTHQELSKKFSGMMGTLDYYFRNEYLKK